MVNLSTFCVAGRFGRFGRWKRGSVVGNPDSGITPDKTWQNLLNNAGTILDHAPALAQEVVAQTVSYGNG